MSTTIFADMRFYSLKGVSQGDYADRMFPEAKDTLIVLAKSYDTNVLPHDPEWHAVFIGTTERFNRVIRPRISQNIYDGTLMVAGNRTDEDFDQFCRVAVKAARTPGARDLSFLLGKAWWRPDADVSLLPADNSRIGLSTSSPSEGQDYRLETDSDVDELVRQCLALQKADPDNAGPRACYAPTHWKKDGLLA